MLRDVLGCRIAAGVQERLGVSQSDFSVEGRVDIETATSRHYFGNSSDFVWRFELLAGLWMS